MVHTATARGNSIATFGEALKRCRVEWNLTHNDLSRRCGVRADIIRSWERDESRPTAQQFKRLRGSLPRIKGFVDLLQLPPHEREVATEHVDFSTQIGEQAAALHVETHGAPEPEPPKTLGEALRAARLDAGLDQHDVGELLSVDQATVSAWELGRAMPIADHVRRLSELWPPLAVWIEQARDIPKPPGPAGMTLQGSSEPRFTSWGDPFVAPSPPAPSPSVEVVQASVEALGGELGRRMLEEAQARARVVQLEGELLRARLAVSAAADEVAKAQRALADAVEREASA